MSAEKVPVDYQDYASEAEELADLLADNRLSELAELDEDDLKRVIESIRASDPIVRRGTHGLHGGRDCAALR